MRELKEIRVDLAATFFDCHAVFKKCQVEPAEGYDPLALRFAEAEADKLAAEWLRSEAGYGDSDIGEHPISTLASYLDNRETTAIDNAAREAGITFDEMMRWVLAEVWPGSKHVPNYEA